MCVCEMSASWEGGRAIPEYAGSKHNRQWDRSHLVLSCKYGWVRRGGGGVVSEGWVGEERWRRGGE